MMTEENKDETGDSKDPAGGLLRYDPKGEDQQIRDIYGDWVHSNDGAHLSRGSRMTRRGRPAGRTWRSCLQGGMMLQVGDSGAALSKRWLCNS